MKDNARERSKSVISQTFHLTAPEARLVLLAGDFTRWQHAAIPMRRVGDGVWGATVVLAPGRHAYRLIVDGEWRDDPACRLRVPNPFGSEDMIRDIRQAA